MYEEACTETRCRPHWREATMLSSGGRCECARRVARKRAAAASRAEHSAVVMLLIYYGADANAQGVYGNTLKAARRYGDRLIVQLLLEHGAIGVTNWTKSRTKEPSIARLMAERKIGCRRRRIRMVAPKSIRVIGIYSIVPIYVGSMCSTVASSVDLPRRIFVPRGEDGCFFFCGIQAYSRSCQLPMPLRCLKRTTKQQQSRGYWLYPEACDQMDGRLAMASLRVLQQVLL